MWEGGGGGGGGGAIPNATLSPPDGVCIKDGQRFESVEGFIDCERQSHN